MCRLELEVKKWRDVVIADYKVFIEFQDLLDADYDANCPVTFHNCWETFHRGDWVEDP